MSEKRRFVDENQKWFIDFLPSEVFYSLSSEDQVHYNEYKKYKGLKEKSESLIADLEKQNEMNQKLIDEEKFRINGDSENSGYEMKMGKHYDSITSVDKDFPFSCSVSEVDKSYKPKNTGNISLGNEVEIKQFLSDLYDEDCSKDDKEIMRDEIRGIICQYARYMIYDTNWIQFGLDTHTLKSIKAWCDKMGDNRYEWGGVKQ